MVKKIITGLAISVGAGLALTVSTRTTRKESGKTGWRPAAAGNTTTPVTIRINTACPRKENIGTEFAPTSDSVATAEDPQETMALTTTPERSAELAEIRVMIETLDNRTTEMIRTVNQRIDDLQSHLPRFIDVKVASRIREVEERLRTEFHDEQSRTLDAFLKTLDQKVLPRISLVETAIEAQGEEIGRMRQRIEKTDDTLDRVLERLDKMVDSISAPPSSGHTNSHVMEINQQAVA